MRAVMTIQKNSHFSIWCYFKWRVTALVRLATEIISDWNSSFGTNNTALNSIRTVCAEIEDEMVFTSFLYVYPPKWWAVSVECMCSVWICFNVLYCCSADVVWCFVFAAILATHCVYVWFMSCLHTFSFWRSFSTVHHCSFPFVSSLFGTTYE